jgi:hypothetical protein
LAFTKSGNQRIIQSREERQAVSLLWNALQQGLASLFPVMPGERKSLGGDKKKGGEEVDESKSPR